MIHKVISGGQTGADLAGLRAALALSIPTGGWAPRGYMTEKGPRPALLRDIYDLQEHPSAKYPPRTKANILDSDITIIIAQELDRGSGLTLNLCQQCGKPFFRVYPTDLQSERKFLEVCNWLMVHDPHVINVAGNRESKSPGIEQASIPFLKAVFRAFNKPTWRGP